MGRTERMELLKKLETITDSKVLVYITGDRRGLETRIASDVFTLAFNHLSKFGQVRKVNLFLYTTGGITISGYGLVNMIREFCDEFGVLIPFRALSTGTLISLGADTIVMSKMGQLGPVDPSLNHPLGPSTTHPQNPNVKALIPVNVEDVLSFFALAKKESYATSSRELGEVFKTLASSVHPIVLGAVNRARDQIKFLAKTLLSYHINNPAKIEKIVKTLLEQRFSHDYLVGRKEAKTVVGLNILDVPKELDDTILALYNEYNALLRLDSPYNPQLELGAQQQVTATFHRGVVESVGLTHTFTTVRDIQRVQIQQQGLPITQYLENLMDEGWIENNTV